MYGVPFNKNSLIESVGGFLKFAINPLLELSPEQALLLAIIRRAIFDAKETSGYFKRDAIAWLRNTKETPLSMHWILNHLKLEPTRKAKLAIANYLFNTEDA